MNLFNATFAFATFAEINNRFIIIEIRCHEIRSYNTCKDMFIPTEYRLNGLCNNKQLHMYDPSKHQVYNIIRITKFHVVLLWLHIVDVLVEVNMIQ